VGFVGAYDETIGSIGVIAEEKCVLLSYQRNNSEESKDMKYSVDIEWTSCNLGGMRPWFRCPARNCGRRVAILYSGAIFACRHCYQLVYSCQRENLAYRAAHRAEKIRDRLGWEFSIFDGVELKPKGMHWKTFNRLCMLHNKHANTSFRDAALRFGINPFEP